MMVKTMIGRLYSVATELDKIGYHVPAHEAREQAHRVSLAASALESYDRIVRDAKWKARREAKAR